MKTLVVFLEGTDWSFVQPLVARGLLPTIQTLVSRGVSADMISLPPFAAPMLLASAVTGQRAWRHGVIAGPVRATTPPRTAALWDIAGQAGLRSIVVGGQDWIPDHAFDGVLVPEAFFQSGGAEVAVHPRALSEELAPLRVDLSSLAPGAIRLLCPRLEPEIALHDPLALQLAVAVCHLYSVHNVASSLLETETWQLGIVHHSFFASILSSFGSLPHSSTPRAVQTRYEGVTENACRLLDLLLRELLTAAGADTRIFIASTRGRAVLSPGAGMDYPLQPAGAGLFAAAGPGMRQGLRLGSIHLLDLAPTVLRSLDLPGARDQDGRPLVEIFDPPVTLTPVESWGGRAAELAPLPLSDASACFRLGLDLIEATRFEEARLPLQRAHRLRPENPIFAFWLACCQARLGQLDAAWKTADVLRDHLSPERLDVAARLALLAEQAGQPGRVLEFLPFPVEPGKLPPIAVGCLAKALMAANRWADAFALLRDHLPLRPTNDIWLGLARCYLHLHRYQDAEKAARHAIADNPGLAFAHIHLAHALVGQNRQEEARDALREAHRLAPHFAEVRTVVHELDPTLAGELSWSPSALPPPAVPAFSGDDAAELEDVSADSVDVSSGSTVVVIARVPHRRPESFVFRPPRPHEAPRLGSLAPALAHPSDWHSRVWETSGPAARFVGCARWRPAPGDLSTVHLFVTLAPRVRVEAFARELLRPVLSEIQDTGAHQIVVTTHEAGEWERGLRHHFPQIKAWTDEDWIGDPLLLRERLCRYDSAEVSALKSGWTVRPLVAGDWDFVQQWGVAKNYFSAEHFEKLKRHHAPDLSWWAQHPDGPAGLLVAARRERAAGLEFICGHPRHPERWGLATALLLRRFVAYGTPTVPYDSFRLTTNLNRNRAMHVLATRLGLRRTREHHHFQITLHAVRTTA